MTQAVGTSAPRSGLVTYQFNPACWCPWCENGGRNPAPGDPQALGYEEPHIPPKRDR